MDRTIRQAVIVGVGDTGIAVLSKLRKQLIHLSNGKGIPTISLIALFDGESASGKDSVEEEQKAQPIYHLPLSMQPMDDSVVQLLSPDLQSAAGELKSKSSSERQTRLDAWLKFFSNAASIDRLIRERTLQVIDAPARSALAAMGMTVRSEKALDIFVVGALDDPLASSMLVEIPYLIQHTLEYQLIAERTSKHYTGILFLPVFSDASMDVGDIRARRELEYVQQANTYAALKELDYYMDRGHYVRRFDPGLQVKRDAAPYHHVYLVDAVNEANQRIPTLSQMTEMVAEWLDQTLTTTIGEELGKQGAQGGNVRSYGKLAVYSGLGLSAYILPIEEVIEVGAIRLGLDMVGPLGLLHEQPSEAFDPVTFFNLQRNEARDRLRDEDGLSKKINEYMAVSQKVFQNMAPYDLKVFFDRVNRTFGYNYTKRLPDIETSMSNNLENLLDEGRDRIEKKAFGLVDGEHIGGISAAVRSLRSLGKRLDGFVEEEREGLRKATGQLKRATDEVQKTQAAHIAAVYAFYPEGWGEQIAAWGGMVGFILLSLWFSVTSFFFAKDNLVGLITEWSGYDLGLLARIELQVASFLALIAAILAIGVAGYSVYRWWQRSRAGYIYSHRSRLKAALDKVTGEMALHYFSEMRAVIRDVSGEIVGLRDKIEAVQDALQRRLDAPHALYGSPRFILEESLLQEEDFEEFYQEIVGKSVEDELYRFTQEEQYGPVSRWRSMTIEEIEKALRAFGKMDMADLRTEKDVETLLIKHAQLAQDDALAQRLTSETDKTDTKLRAVQARMRKLVDNSKPFLRYNPTTLSAEASPLLVQAVGFRGANNEDSMVDRAVEQIGVGTGSQIVTIRIPDRHRIVSMAARHGLPLSSIGMLTGYREQYNRFRARNEQGLHVQSKYLMLPDIFPMHYEGRLILEPQEAVALGIAFDKVHWNSRKKSYECRYRDSYLRKDVIVPLGEDKPAATVYLQDHVDILAILSEQIDMEVISRSRQAGEEQSQEISDRSDEVDVTPQERRSGIEASNRPVIEFLYGYMEKNKRSRSKRRVLEDWEVLIIDEYINKLSK